MKLAFTHEVSLSLESLYEFIKSQLHTKLFHYDSAVSFEIWQNVGIKSNHKAESGSGAMDRALAKQTT